MIPIAYCTIRAKSITLFMHQRPLNEDFYTHTH
uniref:Uncharacterized protein n=1 Tax=Anguilla anguilla TaxID=7936 RepID=A0A0E9UWK8_ANGAN